MLEALLEPVAGPAADDASPARAGGDAAPGGADDHLLAILRSIPEVECLFGGIVASWHSSFGSLHSRCRHRVAYTKPLLITPLDDVSELPSERSFVALGRDLSLSGFSFCHPRPLASRKVIVRFRALDPSSTDGVLAVLRWFRYRRDGSYQSGGQFLRCVPASGSASAADCECGDEEPAVTQCSRAF